MRVFAIGDLHLSTVDRKAMDKFGPQWANHDERIREDWEKRVGDEDIVLIAGDTSWAMHLEEAIPDLMWISALPGTKILIRGNHDYWWSSPAKIRSVLPKDMHIIQNDALKMGDTAFCGTRGWVFPMGGPLGAEDQKIFDREKIRLRMSLDRAKRMDARQLIVLMHYPPLYDNYPDTDFTDILEEYKADRVVFGHLHGDVLKQVHLTDYESGGVVYDLTSADYLHFGLRELPITVSAQEEQTAAPSAH